MNLDTLWDRVLLALENATNADHGEDDAGMREASDEDLIMWCDDLRDRVGLDTTAMREAMDAFIAARSL